MTVDPLRPPETDQEPQPTGPDFSTRAIVSGAGALGIVVVGIATMPGYDLYRFVAVIGAALVWVIAIRRLT